MIPEPETVIPSKRGSLRATAARRGIFTTRYIGHLDLARAGETDGRHAQDEGVLGLVFLELGIAPQRVEIVVRKDPGIRPSKIEDAAQGRQSGIAITAQRKQAGLVVEIPGRRGVVGTEYLLPNFEATSIPLQGFVILALLVVVKPEQLEGPGYTEMLGAVSFLGDLQSPVKVFAGLGIDLACIGICTLGQVNLGS